MISFLLSSFFCIIYTYISYGRVGNDSLLLIFYYYIMYVYFLVQLLIIVFPGCIWAGLNVIVPNFIFGNFSKMREDFVKKKKKKNYKIS